MFVGFFIANTLANNFVQKHRGIKMDKENMDKVKTDKIDSAPNSPRFFVRIGSGSHFLKIFKSITLPQSSIAVFVTGPVTGVTIMCYDHCIQGNAMVYTCLYTGNE